MLHLGFLITADQGKQNTSVFWVGVVTRTVVGGGHAGDELRAVVSSILSRT